MNMKKIITSLVVAFAVVVGTGVGVTRLTEDSYTVTVADKYPKGQDYLVFTDKGTFKVSDSTWYLRFNSSDVWGTIKPNSTYKITATGFRIGLLSWYENIVKMEEISK